MAMKLSRLLLSTVLVLAALAGILLSRPAPVSAAGPWYVATTGNDTTGTGTFANPWRHIQYAVDNASVLSGDIINVAAGTYTEQVTIGKSLTLKGPDTFPATAVIVQPSTGQIYIVGITSALLDVRLENLGINANNLRSDLASYSGVLHQSTGSLVVDNCWIEGFNTGDGAMTYGIFVIGGGTATITGNTQIKGGKVGIVSDGTTGMTITGNEILNQSECGIEFLGSTGTDLVQNNEIHGINSGTGFGIYNTTGAVADGRIVDNRIYGCKTAIMLADATSTWSVTKNLIRNCTVSGVSSFCPISVFSQNTIFACVGGIDLAASANIFTAHCNAILGNTTAGLKLGANGTYDVTNNYWGRNNGPNVDGAGPGTGDKILRTTFTGLTYNPWIVISISAAPATAVANGTSTSTITLDCTKNSAGAATGCTIPVLANAVFTTNLGSFSGATTVTRPLVASLASAALASGTAGTATVTGYVAELWTAGLAELVTTPVVFTTPPAPVNPLVGAGAPTSHGSSVVGPATSTPPVLLPGIQTQSASLSAKTVTPGDPITVTANLINKSTVNGNKKVTLYVNGQVETTQGVTVNSGGSTKLTFNVSRSEPGDYSVYVDGVPAGSFKVELFRESDGILIFSVIMLAVAFILGMVMLWRRQQRTG